MAELFGARLRERRRELGALCVGIDPSASVLESWGRPPTIEGLEYVAREILEVVGELVAVVKVQVAFFERFGSAGLRVLESLLGDARDVGVVTIADAKRGDIASTNEGYAEAWLGAGSPLRSDAVTASPYLGVAALAPLYRVAAETGRGFFVLAATSNDEGRLVQDARDVQGRRVRDLVLDDVAAYNDRLDGLGSLGVVLGATREPPAFDLSRLGGPVLVPGVGTQGGSLEQVARLSAACAPDTVIVNVSRAIAAAGPDRRALRDATRRWRDDAAVL